MKKKIMHVTQANGGVAEYIKMLLKYIDRDKYENILVYPTEYKDEEKNFRNLVDFFELIDFTREINCINDLKSLMQLIKVVKKYNPDLIYLHSSKAGALGRILRFIIKKPIIYNPHGWAFNMRVSSKKVKLYEIIERFLANNCDKIIAISEQEVESAIKKRICKEDKISLIYNGIDITKYDEIIDKNINYKKNLNIPSNSIVIGMVGRISKQKGPDIFVEVAKRVKKEIPNSFFIIVGEGEDRNEIEIKIEEAGISDSFIITGWVEECYRYIEAFDIAMLLSRWEGFGLAIAEYMVAGKPIVATNVDAIPNLLTNNVEGILVEPENVEQAVKAVERFITDEKFAVTTSKNAILKVRNKFDIKRVAYQHEELIMKILNN